MTVTLRSNVSGADARVMSAWKILGPDGKAMVTSGARAPGSEVAKQLNLSPAARDELEQAWAQDVSKKVRSRGITMAVADRERGRPKPTPVTFETLRLMAARNEWVRSIVLTRKRQVGGKTWTINVKEEDASGAAARAAKDMTKLLQRPMMHGSSPRSTTWRQWIGMYVEDLLVLDRGVVEKERDLAGAGIKALYNVDGATVRPNIDDRGHYHQDAYVQMVDGVVEARFGVEELIVGMENEQTDVRFAGYGMSPLETLIVSVTADLHAAKFNSDYFTKGAVPEGVLSLGEDVEPEDVDAFRLYWMSEIMGKPWSLPIIGGSKAPEWMSWRESNRDMQFMEYQQWLLQKMCSVFQISPKEFGQIDDVNRSTAEDASESDDEKGLKPLLASIADSINLDVIGEHGVGLGDYLEFAFDEQGESAEQVNQRMQPMHAAGVATGAEWRDAHGMDPDGDPKATHGKEGLRMHLKGDGTPLPSKQDADVAGIAAQQDREDEQADDQRAHEDVQGDKQRQHDAQQADGGGDAAQTPWKPADPDDPDVQQAMDDHDRESGIGPRNVKKTAPDGYDRHPALTKEADSLDDVFERASARLVEGLADVLSGGRS